MLGLTGICEKRLSSLFRPPALAAEFGDGGLPKPRARKAQKSQVLDLRGFVLRAE